MIDNASPWFNPTMSDPVYFNACYTGPTWLGVPLNSWGFQNARTGVAYAAIASYADIDERVYIEAPLTDTLIKGKKYCVEFYVSLADVCKVASNNIGVCFTKDSLINYSISYLYLLPGIPQIEEKEIITDTTNWVLISGNFVANGGERFMTIGNFRNNANTDTLTVGGISSEANYYLDDVSVMRMPEIKAGYDTTINEGDSAKLYTTTDATWNVSYNWQPATGLSCANCPNPTASPTETTVYKVTVSDSLGCPNTDSVTVTVIQKLVIPNVITPNGDGVNDKFEIKGLTEGATLQIFNRWGELVFYAANYPNSWDAANVPDGVYYYMLTLPNKEKRNGFVEVVK